MKRSRTVPLSLVSTLAAAAMAAGCGSRSTAQTQGWQTCVDRDKNTVVDRQYCDSDWDSPHPSGYVPHFFWYYYPRSYYWDAPRIGMPIPVGGSYGPAPFASAPMAGSGAAVHSVVRGGFGSTAAGHASGGE
jgi:hypothetical protein